MPADDLSRKPHENAPHGFVRIYCTSDGCVHSADLPYTDETRTEVAIAPIDGWTTPPLRCPTCSTITTQLAVEREVIRAR